MTPYACTANKGIQYGVEFRGTAMRLGFVGGAIFATWLTLTYPEQMEAAFEKLTSFVQEFLPENTNVITPSDKM